MSVEALLRPEIRDLEPYVTARQESASVRLNANELPWSPVTTAMPMNRYPVIRPALLQQSLAELYGVAAGNLLATRGSSEAIDLLVRAFCRAGRDSIMINPPTFAMYRVYADIQGARTLNVPRPADDGFNLDVEATLAGCEADTKLIFVCSPNNPSGGTVPRASILELVRARAGQSIVVVDEAYSEFSGQESLAISIGESVGEFDNLVVLRTLSKALGLAGVRCGAVIASAPLIGWLNRLLAPYALATPVIDRVLEALSADHLASARQAVAEIVRERERLSRALAALPQVSRVWPSQTNFLLTQFRNFEEAMQAVRERRILVRHFPGDPQLANCARITVGTREENDLLLAVLADSPEAY